MKTLHCPLNGPRNISEFVYGGELEFMPDPNACESAEWAEYLFFDRNPVGIVKEWWCHAPTSFWFIGERNTLTNEIIRTYKAAEVFDQRVEFNSAEGPAP
ncbi:MAG: sarcosine oxidase subunit delta [Pseudomonadales bacterium]